MTESTPNAGYAQTSSAPDAELRKLDRLVGTWKVSGGATGEITYRWMEGGFFLLQDVTLENEGTHTTGLEVIGRERPFMAETPGEDIKSRFYDNQGNTLDYVYEPRGEDTFIIWGEEKGSPAYCTNTFSTDGNTVTSEWVWPGGGYTSTMTRVR